MYKVGKKTYYEESAVNRKILRCFTKCVLIADVTSMASYIISQYDPDAPFNILDTEACPACGSIELNRCGVETIKVDYDDGYVCPVCGEKYESRELAQTCCAQNHEVITCMDCGSVYYDDYELDFIEEDPNAYKWFIVPKWAAESLEKSGELIVTADTYSIWGHEIEDEDEDMSENEFIFTLAYEANILDGQEKSWACIVGG